MKWFTPFRICALCIVLMVIAAYSNHFHNDFHFDDDHTILNNIFVRKIANIPQFFKSATTFSSLPPNQTYRPMLTALYAVAYSIDGAKPLWFHIFIFGFYLLQGVLLYLLVIRIFNFSPPNNISNKYFALFATGWYMLNTANADTINYISSASDSVSTCWLLAAMVTYIYKPQWRRYGVYLLLAAIGILFKQSVLAFAGLLPVYHYIFESGKESFSKRVTKTVIQSVPAIIVCAILYEVQAKLTSTTYITGGRPFNYIITQPYIMLHYFLNFFYPTSLSADTDWQALDSVADYRFWLGLIFIGLLVFIVIRQLSRKQNLPIAFGLAWFVITLLPSSLTPLAEVMNDYRPFVAYVGLAIAASWFIYQLWQKYILPKGQYVRVYILAMVIVLLGNTIGTYARNKVWKTEESLWLDVTEKSPNNGRGLMNYGLVQMKKANYPVAEEYFTRGLKVLPYYSYLYANMAVLKAAEGKTDEAEANFKKSIDYGEGIPGMYYFYAKFLHQQGRDKEALPMVQHAIQLAPADINSRYLAMEVYQSVEDYTDMTDMAKQTLALVPNDSYTQSFLNNASSQKTKLERALDAVKQNPTVENYLSLSLAYYDKKQYAECIEMAKQALAINPKYALAYNNIGSAYNVLGEWDAAKVALAQALKLQPGYQLAQNNYNYAYRQLVITDSMKAVIIAHPNPENYVTLSLIYYRQGLYLKCVEANKEAIKLKPNYAIAYNNMCAAYNNLQMWDEAIVSGEKAVQLDPASQLNKNNLATAKQGKANSSK